MTDVPARPGLDWLTTVEPLAKRLDLAVKLDLEFVHSGEGADALAKLLRGMALLLDQAAHYVPPAKVAEFMEAAKREAMREAAHTASLYGKGKQGFQASEDIQSAILKLASESPPINEIERMAREASRDAYNTTKSLLEQGSGRTFFGVQHVGGRIFLDIIVDPEKKP